MLNEQEIAHYNRHLMMPEIGMEGQLKLKSSRVLVIGAGGLGCPVLHYLTAAGIGTIGIADFDQVQVSNLQRQVLFGYSSIGKKKAIVASERLKDLNPNCRFELYLDGITSTNAGEIISKFDVIVDCTDNFSSRYLINDTCMLHDKPLIYGAIHRMEGQVAVFNYQGGPTYRCLYGDSPKRSGFSCSEIGVLGALPGIIGTLQAIEVIKIITNVGEVLSGKVLLYDAKKNSFQSIGLKRKDVDYSRVSTSVRDACGNQSSFEKLNAFEQVIDVRNSHEEPRLKHKNLLSIELHELAERIEEIDPSQSTIVVCQSGMRSAQALQTILEFIEIENITHLEGGINLLNQPEMHEKLF